LHKKIHIIQRKDENLENLYSKLGVSYELHDFVNTVTALPKSHLVIARAGCGTLADLVNAKRASILIPWSGALDNHQEYNAMCMGSDWSFPEGIEPAKLAHLLKQLMLDFFENGYDKSMIKQRAEYRDAPSGVGGQEIAKYLSKSYH
jgi:UDP-N-acetylglucosamine--N-acetylmuramyl-(pentapeptide) pyrophosphoryl-undecaprenol N-acetylglucosamine transferase